MNVGGEGFERFDGGVNIGGLGVVVVFDAFDRSDILQAMLNRLEVANGLADLVRRNPHQGAGANRCQNVLHVVRAFQADLTDQHDLALANAITKKDAAVVDVSALLDLLLSAEPEDLSARPIWQSQASGIVFVEDNVVGGLLIFEDAGFGVDVGLECAVAIEMIGSDVQNYRNLGPEGLDGFQLKAGDFEHHDSLRRGAVDQGNRG